MTDIAALSACELLHLYRRHDLSPVEATRAALDRIQRFNPAVNAYCLVDEDRALAAARQSEQRWMASAPKGWVDGVPTSIKDLLLSKGWPTLRGSRTVDPNQPWIENAPCVDRLEEHGAVFLGKTTTPEFGWKGVTDSPLAGVTRNPWNTARTAGGSSGGGAAAAALGMGTLHLGTDGGGSIRIPAGLCGIFGLKPSFGRVPAFPLSPFGTVAHVGPMTRTVEDAALMMNVLALPDARDWHALPYDGRDYRQGLDDGVRGLRIAYSADLGYIDVNPDIAEAVARAVQVFSDLGATIEPVDPGFTDPLDTFCKLWFTGAANALAHLSEDQRAGMDPGLVEIARTGAAYDHMEYIKATNERGRLGQHMRLFHQRYDLLLTPTLPIPAFAAGQEVADPARQTRWMEWTRFSYPFNLTQQPAATVPCGFTADGLPIGLHIVGPMHHDALVLRASRAFEAAHPFRLPEQPRAVVTP